MPYRHAHWFLLLVLALAGLAFWPAYLSQAATAPFEFHAHGITATLWLLLLIAQSLTIHRAQRGVHRALGKASLVLFPLFMAGGAGIFLGMARRFVEAPSPFYPMFAARLAWIDVVTVAAFALCYHEALRNRRDVQIHSRYLLATPLFLLPPILGRLSPLLPGLWIAGPEDLWKLGIGFQLGNAVAAAIAFGLAARSGGHGRPFMLAGAAILIGGLCYQTIGGMAWWKAMFAQFAALPSLPLALAAGLAGVAIAMSGWIAGKRVRPANS
jgi:hypothetical protein